MYSSCASSSSFAAATPRSSSEVCWLSCFCCSPRPAVGPRWPNSEMNFPSLVNLSSVSPAPAPPSQTFFLLSTKMVCSELGQPGAYPGPPQDLRRLPAVSNSSTAGGGKQHSADGGFSVAKFSVLSRSRERVSTQI